MLPLPHLLGISAAIAILSAAGGYTYGYSKATDKYAPEIANLKASIKSADEQAKIQQVKNKEALDENRIVAKDLAGRIAAYADERNARVQDLRARNTALSNAVTASSQGDISESCESRFDRYATGQEIKYAELEGRCITDAAARVIIRDWAERIGLKPMQ